MSARTIYIAGPMTGLPEYNYPAFIEAAKMLTAAHPDAVIINPAENFDRQTGLPYPTYIRRSFEQVLASTELYVLAGWMSSKGARAELTMAKLLDLVIVFEAFESTESSHVKSTSSQEGAEVPSVLVAERVETLTPRTDAVVHGQYDMGCPEFVVSVEFARDLEKEAANVPALINALKYAADGIAKMAEHVDMEAVEAEGLDVQDCRDCVEFAIERAGGAL